MTVNKENEAGKCSFGCTPLIGEAPPKANEVSKSNLELDTSRGGRFRREVTAYG